MKDGWISWIVIAIIVICGLAINVWITKTVVNRDLPLWLKFLILS